jgi:hypothetical protein
MSVVRRARLSDVARAALVKNRAFESRGRPGGFWLEVTVASKMPVCLLAAFAQVCAGELWTNGGSAFVALLSPRKSRGQRVRNTVVGSGGFLLIGFLLAALLSLFALAAWLLLGAAFLILIGWFLVLTWSVIRVQAETKFARSELRELRRQKPGGWMIADLASDETMIGEPFVLATAAVRTCLPDGGLVYAAAIGKREAKLYSRRMRPFGESGLVFFEQVDRACA